MKIHLQALELYMGDDGKVKYRHKRQHQFGTRTERAVCGKNVSSYTVEIPAWYEYKKTDRGLLCQHCVESLEKKKREVRS